MDPAGASTSGPEKLESPPPVRQQRIAPPLELDPLVARREEALGERDRPLEVEALGGDLEAALRLPPGPTPAPVADRPCAPKHRLQRLQERAVRRRQGHLEDEAHPLRAVGEGFAAFGAAEAPLTGDEATEEVACRLQNRW